MTYHSLNLLSNANEFNPEVAFVLDSRSSLLPESDSQSTVRVRNVREYNPAMDMKVQQE